MGTIDSSYKCSLLGRVMVFTVPRKQALINGMEFSGECPKVKMEIDLAPGLNIIITFP